MLEAVWEHTAQMKAHNLENPFNYVSCCRNWRQLKIEQQQGILSHQFHGEHDAHLFIPESNFTDLVEQPESTDWAAASLSALQAPALPTLSVPESNADTADVVSNTRRRSGVGMIRLLISFIG